MQIASSTQQRGILSFLEHLAASTLWEHSFPAFFQYGIMLLSNLQLIAISFQNRLEFLRTEKEITNSISVALNLTTMRDLFAGDPTTSFRNSCIVVLSLYFMIALLSHCWAIKFYFSRRKFSGKSKQILTILNQTHQAFLFTIINIALAYSLKGLEANSASAWCTFVLVVILLLFNYILGLFEALFSYDPFGKLNLFACHSIRFQLLTFILKAILTLLTVLIDSAPIRYYVNTGLSLLLLALRHYDLIESFSFYEFQAMKTTVAISSICLGNAFVNLFSIPLSKSDNFTTDDTIFIEIIFSLLFLVFWDAIFKKRMFATLERNNKNIRSGKEALKKLFTISHFVKNTKISVAPDAVLQPNEVYFWGLVLREMEANDYEVEDVSNFRSQNGKLILQTLMRKMKGQLEKGKKLQILILSDLVEDPKYVIASTLYLNVLTKNADFQTRVITYKLKERLRQSMTLFFEEQNAKGLDVRTFMNFETISQEFLKMIYSNTQTHLLFWTNYTKQEIEIKKLSETSKMFEKNNDKIQRYWNKTIENKISFANSLVNIYSIYLSYVRNRPVSATKIQKKISLLNSLSDHTDDNLNEHGTLIINITMTQEKTGHISDISSHVQEVLGYPTQGVIGRNINTLIPWFIRDKHEEMIKLYLEGAKSLESFKLLGHKLNTFVLNQKGQLVLCKAHLSLSPTIQNGLAYVMMLRVIETERDDYILVAENDYAVEGFTEGIGYQLELETNRKFFLHDICLNSNELTKSNDDRLLSSDATWNVKLRFQTYHKEIIYRHTEVKKHRFCNISTYVLHLGKTEYIDDKSIPVTDEDEAENISAERSSNRVIEVNMFDHAEAIPESSPLPFRKGSARIITEHTLSQPMETLLITERNKLISSPKSEHEHDIVVPLPTTTPKEQAKKIEGAVHHKTVDDRDNYSMSIFTGKRYSERIEKAIHFVPIDTKMRVLKIIGTILVIASAACVIGFQYQNTTALDFLSGNINILSRTKYMLVQALRVNRLTRFVVFTDADLLYGARYLPYAVVPNISATVLAPVAGLATDMININNNIQSSLYKIDPVLQERLYQPKYVIYSQDSTNQTISSHTANIFDFITQLSAEAFRLGSAGLNKRNSSVFFILNNTLNDLLLGGEQIIPILLEDSQNKLEEQSVVVAIMFSIMVIFVLIITKTAYTLIKSFVRTRNRFLDILLILEEKSIQEHIRIINRFSTALEKSNFNCRSERLDVEKRDFKPLKSRLINAKITKRSANRRDINRFLFFNCLAMGLFIVAILIIYLALYLMATIQADSITNKLELMTQSDHYLYELTLLYCIQYTYIGENRTTIVRGRPIADEWNDTYNNFTESQDFYLNTLLDEKEGVGMNSELVNIVKGDLCSIMNITTTSASLCRMLKGGILQAGIVGMNSFFLTALQDTIADFDSSADHTYADLVQILNAPDISMEDVLSFYFINKAYELASDFMLRLLKTDITNLMRSFGIITLTYSIICILVAILVWIKICNSLEKEMTYWKKIVRQIPWEIIMNNKFLKSLLHININS